MGILFTCSPVMQTCPLSEATLHWIRASVPILESRGVELTQLFYERMFRENPEVKAFFNPAHQVAGSQPRALAGAICAFARHVENPEALTSALERIAHKHVSLQVLPEHYPIVGQNLLAAIKELLGDAATPELISAWGEAYGLLAGILIQRESGLYEEKITVPGGWSGFRALKVVEVRRETDEVRSLYLEDSEGKRLPSFKAGQYLTLRLPLGEAGTTMRNYSLSGGPRWSRYRISVKREGGVGTPDGVVSNYLHQSIDVGSLLDVAQASGEFYLNSAHMNRPRVFIAGGIGVTPLLSMLHALVENGSQVPVTFIQGTRSPATLVFAGEIRRLLSAIPGARHHVRYSDEGPDAGDKGEGWDRGLLDETLLRQLNIDPESDTYFCGPPRMMSLVQRGLTAIGIPEERRRNEFFGPADPVAA